MVKSLKRLGIWNGVAALMLLLVGGFGPGCAADFVKVNTPDRAVDAGLPVTLSLNDSVEAFNAHFAEQEVLAQVWSARIEIGQEKVAWIDGLTGNLVSPETLAVLGFNPVGGVGLAASYLLGLFRRKPGDVSALILKDEKIDSYNKGVEVTAKLLNAPKLPKEAIDV